MNPHKPTVLITGASGLIGTELARALVDRYQIVAFDIKDGETLPPDTEYIHVDLTSDESVADGLRQVRERFGNRIASVVHLAAYYDFSGEPSPLYEDITVKGTGRLLDGLKSFDVEQFIFSSTLLVYAPCMLGQRIDEDWPHDPKWDYPRSKVRTENLLHDRHGSIPLVILRIAGIYDELCHSLPISQQIRRIYERRTTGKVYPGDPEMGQAFLHLDDLIDGIDRVIERRAQLPEELRLILGEPETMSYGDLQRELGMLIHGEDWTPARIPKPIAKVGAWVQDKIPVGEDPFIKPWMIDMADDHYAVDITRARTLLGWEPQHRLRTTLPHMVHALKTDPARWYEENGLEPQESQEQPEEISGTR